MNVGIEMEFWVVDGRGRLCDGAEIVDASSHVHPEFIGPLIEVQTTPHETETGLRQELERTLESALSAAEATDKQLVPLGTPLTEASPPAVGERGRLFERIYGDGVESAKNCAGAHVHFEKGAVRRQLNVLTALDPAIALVNSSPYYLGERGMNSSRAAAYRRECGESFRLYCDLWPYADSVSGWESRIDGAFEAFRDLAAERDVSPDRVDELFDPEDTVLNPVRLRTTLPTVEWRAPDTALPSQIVRLAFDARRLVSQTREKRVAFTGDVEQCGVGEDLVRVPAFPALRSISEEAIRLGLGSKRVSSYLDRMGFDPTAYRPIANGFGGPGTLREPEARNLRLAYASRLEDDVGTLTDGSGRGDDRRRDGLATFPVG